MVANEVLVYHSYSHSSPTRIYLSMKIAKEVIRIQQTYFQAVLLHELSHFLARNYVKPGIIFL